MQPCELDPTQCLKSTAHLDFEHPLVANFVAQHALGETLFEQAISLYYAVRDKISYNPHRIDLSVNGLSASFVIEKRRGWCVNKAVLLAACCRAIGVPAGLGFADVKNHITTAKLRQSMGSDVFYWHSYAVLYLNGKWVKATPAFNQRLCNKFGILAADFDGINDSIFMPFNAAGDKHMEYLNYRGEFYDVPLTEIVATFEKEYPQLDCNH